MQKITVLHLIPNLLTGGAERLTVDLVNELSQRVDVKLILFYSLDSFPDQHFLKDLNKDVSVEFLNKKKGFSLKIYFKLFKILRRDKPAIVHTHLYIFKYIAPFFLLFRGKIKGVHTIHSEADRESPNLIDRILKRFLFKYRLCYPVVISKGNINSYERIYGNIPFTLIENGRKVQGPSGEFYRLRERFDAKVKRNGDKIFLFVGRLEEVKNPELLIYAFDKLRTTNLNAKLVIIGRDTKYFSKANLLELLTRLKLNQNVVYLGEKNNVYDYMLLSDYLCICSKMEGMPISLIEGMSAGLVPVVTKVGGIPDMVGENGYFAKENTIDSYFDALKMAASSSNEDLDLKRENLINEFQVRFDIKICAENYIRLYSEIVKTAN